MSNLLPGVSTIFSSLRCQVESCLNSAAYGLADAYVGHPNIVAVQKQHDSNYEAPKQNFTDLRVANQEEHFLRILKNIFLPNISDQGIFAKYRSQVEEAARRVDVWRQDQLRGAHTYPANAKDIHQDSTFTD